MADTTKIQWADATWNPWLGCTKVSPGCAHCYAENTTRARVLRRQGHETWGRGATRSRTSQAYWKQPLRWDSEASKNHAGIQRAKVFPSLCDWLDDEVPIEWLADFLTLICETPNFDWLLLTKRLENFWRRVQSGLWKNEGLEDDDDGDSEDLPMTKNGEMINNWLGGTPPSNVWLGVSAEDQTRADERIPDLLRIPAKVRFISAEPLLGPVDFRYAAFNGSDSLSGMEGIDWVIVGGESGPKARPCNVEWVRDIVRQCKDAAVPCFVKQLGSRPTCKHSWDGEHCVQCFPFPIRHKKGGDPAEWPEDLRVRQFPEVAR